MGSMQYIIFVFSRWGPNYSFNSIKFVVFSLVCMPTAPWIAKMYVSSSRKETVCLKIAVCFEPMLVLQNISCNLIQFIILYLLCGHLYNSFQIAMGLLHLSVVISIFTNLSYHAQHYIMEILKSFHIAHGSIFCFLCCCAQKRRLMLMSLLGIL